MADKRLKSHQYGFGICCSAAHGASLLEELFVNVESLLHTDDLAISFHPTTRWTRPRSRRTILITQRKQDPLGRKPTLIPSPSAFLEIFRGGRTQREVQREPGDFRVTDEPNPKEGRDGDHDG